MPTLLKQSISLSLENGSINVFAYKNIRYFEENGFFSS